MIANRFRSYKNESIKLAHLSAAAVIITASRLSPDPAQDPVTPVVSGEAEVSVPSDAEVRT